MIHTDGRQTIANAPRREAPAVSPEYVIEADGRQLLERSYAGLQVEILWNVRNDACYLIVRKGGESVGFARVERDDVLDAFEHPYVYLAAAGVSFDA